MMLSILVALLVGQAEVQSVVTAAGNAPRVASSPVARRVNDALVQLFATELDGVSEQSFTVERNDARILVLAVSGESCGAYCEAFTREVSFDMRTGRQLALDDLVTAKGLAKMASLMEAERKRRYRAEAKANAAALRTTPATDKETRDDLEARRALNRSCVEDPPAFDLRFKVGKAGSIVMTSGRCSNHAMRALDDVGEVVLDIPAAKLDLTPYGRSLLLGGPPVAEPGPSSSAEVAK